MRSLLSKSEFIVKSDLIMIEEVFKVNTIKSLMVAILILIMCVGLSGEVFAAPQQFSAEGEYRLGDRDTREDAKRYAVADAKRKIAEQAGVYVESSTEISNFQLVKDKVSVVAQTLMSVKSERTEFTENGVVCKAYVTALVDPDAVESKLVEILKKLNKDAERRENDRREADKRDDDKPARISGPTTPATNTTPSTPSNRKETKEIYTTNDLTGAMAELEEAREKMVRDLSKATAYTAGAEYKLQEVTGLSDKEGHHGEKGEIYNYLKENFEMNKNYRYAELTPFVEIVGAAKIIKVLEEINKKKLLEAKDTMTLAKLERARAKSYGDIVLEEAAEIFARAGELMVEANEAQVNRLKIIRREADDAVKLIRALEARNKNVDEVAKKYEKANKITNKLDKSGKSSKGSKDNKSSSRDDGDDEQSNTGKKVQGFLDNLFKDF